MSLSRRGLLGMLAAGVGAAIVRPGLLMPVKPALIIQTRIHEKDLPGEVLENDFSTDILRYKATERHSNTWRVTGKDAYGNKISVIVDLDNPGKLSFASVTGWHTVWVQVPARA